MSEIQFDISRALKLTPKRWARRRIWIWWIAVICTGIFVFWAGGGVGRTLDAAIANSISRRDYEQAEGWLRFCENLGCSTPETLLLKARLFRKQLKISEVPELLVAADAAGVNRARIRIEYLLLEAQTGRIRHVAEQLNALLQQGGEDGAEICEAYVNGAMMIGATEVAMTILPVWKQEYPQDPQPYYAMARILEYQQNIPDAIRELETANSKDSRHWPSRYALARILYGENRIEEAQQQLEIATQMQSNAAPLLLKAKCLRALGQLQEAHSALAPFATLDRNTVLESFSIVGEPERGYPIEYELGTLEAALGNHAEARRLLEKVLQNDPNHLDARYARALSLRDLGESKLAETELAEVHRIRTVLTEIDRLVDDINKSPAEPHLEARCRIGELFLKYENARRGVFWLQEALNKDPSYRPAHKLLADYYDSLKVREPEYAALADRHRKAADGPAELPPEAGVKP
ncbi:MAG: tetratricopeptide repeat protein [Planctomycetales bacterium]|nr:tetratricopeptide repeat protein [Planctomycetales bacterium]